MDNVKRLLGLQLSLFLFLPLACNQNLNEATTATAQGPSVAEPVLTPRAIKDEVSGQAPVKLYLTQEKLEAQQLTIGLNFFLEEGRSAPRMAEIYLKTSDNLKFRSAQAGGAAQAAGKDVIAQPREDQQVRVTVFSSNNLNNLTNGGLAQLIFEVVPGQGQEGSVEIVPKDAMLAPAGTGEGLELGERLTVAW